MDKERKISTYFVFPPIPDRSFDLCAEYEEDDSEGLAGWGKTEAEAIQDLKENSDS